MSIIEPNEEGKFLCVECGSELNIPNDIYTDPLPKVLEGDRLPQSIIGPIHCPNCGKQYMYDKNKNIVLE